MTHQAFSQKTFPKFLGINPNQKSKIQYGNCKVFMMKYSGKKLMCFSKSIDELEKFNILNFVIFLSVNFLRGINEEKNKYWPSAWHRG